SCFGLMSGWCTTSFGRRQVSGSAGASTSSLDETERRGGGADPMFRVLTLDGGGIRGAFAASLLASVEEDLSASVGEYFDLIAGTSTGGILALALALRVPAAQIVGFYQCYGPKIFARSPLPGFLRQFLFGKYPPHELKIALEQVFKN